MKGERLELVTSFGSLRVCDFVEVKPCAICGKPHRFLLTSLYRGPFKNIQNEWIEDGPVWNCAPGTSCDHTRPVLDRNMVKERRVFRIITGTEQSQSSESRKAVPA